MFTLSKDAKITRVVNSTVAGTSDIDSSRVDMTGFDSVAFVAALGDVTTGSVLQLVAKSNAADSTSSSTTEKSGTSVTAGATDNDNQTFVVDLHKPTLRYAYVTVKRGTANAVVDAVYAVQYNAAKGPLPITQPTTTSPVDVGGPNA